MHPVEAVRVRQSEAPPDVRSVPRFAARWVVGIAVVVAAVHFAASFWGWYFFDEAYMLALGRNHLDWGSADQPPVTPALAAIMDVIAPGSIAVLRVPAVLATAGAVVFAGLIAREFGGDARSQALTAGAQATALWVTMGGHWLTPYSLEPVQWLAILWLLIRWVRVRDDTLLVIMGVVAGVAALTKFQVFLLAGVLLIAVLACGPRELLRRPMLWIGMVIAALITAPTLIWQALHGWPQLQMGAVASSEAELFGGRSGLAVSLVIFAGVAGTVLLGYGLWRLLRAGELRAYRFLAVAFLLLYVVFVVTLGRGYYLGGFYAAVMAAGAVGLQRRREQGRRRWRWVMWPAYALSVAAALAMVATSWVMASAGPARDTAQEVATAYEALPVDRREQAIVFGQSYIFAAFLDVQAEEYSLPLAYSGSRAYGYFEPPPEDKDVVVFVGADPEDLLPFFDSVRRVGDVGEGAGVWVLEGRTQSWDDLWPEIRTLYVE